MNSTRKLYPSIYKDFKEIDVLANIQEAQKSVGLNEIDRFLRNQFIRTCEVGKIEELEKIMKIPIKNEDIDFRRERILNRLSMYPPYSTPFLKMKLNQIIGSGNYNLYMDYENYILYIESSANNQQWFNELYITINKIKPCNIVFINKPVTKRKILANERVEYVKRMYNYRLGAWQLGIHPFTRLGDREDIKLIEGKSITESLLTDLKEYTANLITKVRINNSLVIDEFIFKGIKDNKLAIEYEVNKTHNITEITKIELCDSDNNAKSILEVYVPVMETIELKHVIDIEEGVI